MPKSGYIFRWPVKVLIAGDLGGWKDLVRDVLLSRVDPGKPIGRESCQLYASVC